MREILMKEKRDLFISISLGFWNMAREVDSREARDITTQKKPIQLNLIE